MQGRRLLPLPDLRVKVRYCDGVETRPRKVLVFAQPHKQITVKEVGRVESCRKFLPDKKLTLRAHSRKIVQVPTTQPQWAEGDSEPGVFDILIFSTSFSNLTYTQAEVTPKETKVFTKCNLMSLHTSTHTFLHVFCKHVTVICSFLYNMGSWAALHPQLWLILFIEVYGFKKKKKKPCCFNSSCYNPTQPFLRLL